MPVFEKKRELEATIAVLRQEEEILKRSVAEKSESLSDLRSRILSVNPDYEIVEKEHIAEVEEYQEKKTSLLESIENEQVAVLSVMEERNGLSRTKEKLEKEILVLTENDRKIKAGIETGLPELEQLKSDIQKARVEKARTIRDLDEEIGKKAETLKAIMEDSEKRLKTVEKEERLLSIKKRDLEIYEVRLRKKYPRENIVV